MLRSVRFAIEYFTILIRNIAPLTFKGHPFHKKRLPSYQAFIDDERVNAAIIYEKTDIFALEVLRLPTLREIWKSKNKSRMLVKDKIFDSNINLTTSDGLTINNIITPGGFKSPVKSVYFFANKFTISIAKMNSVAVISSEETILSLNIIISFPESDADSMNYMTNIRFSKEVDGFEFNKQFEFEVNLNSREKALAEKSNELIIYISVATKSSDYRVVQYSRTYAKEIKIEKAVKIHRPRVITKSSGVSKNRRQVEMPSEEEMNRILDSIFEPKESSVK